MRFLKRLLAFVVMGVTVSYMCAKKTRTTTNEAVLCEAGEVPTDIAIAAMLFRFGGYLLILAAILIILFF